MARHANFLTDINLKACPIRVKAFDLEDLLEDSLG